MHDKSASEAAQQFTSAAKYPAVVALFLSYPAAKFGGPVRTIFQAAIQGQISITLFKLAAFVSIALLGLAVAARQWRWIAIPLIRLGGICATIAFYGSAALAGVSMGIVSGLIVDVPFFSAIAISASLALVFVQTAMVFWVAAIVPNTSMPPNNLIKGGVITIASLIISSLAISGLYCERWPEIPGYDAINTGRVCDMLNSNQGH